MNRTAVGDDLQDNEQSRITVTALGLLAFICGATSDISFGVIGDIYVVELALVPLALIMFLIKGGGRAFKAPIFWGFLLAGLLTLIGYMISDLIVGTEQWQYLRGWGRVILLISDCAMLMILVALRRQNLWWFVLGMGVGGVIFLAVSGVSFHTWKLGYGERMSFIVLALVALFPRWLALVVVAGFGVLNIFLDYRNLGAASLVVAAVMWARSANPQRAIRTFGQYSRFLIVGFVVLVLLLLSLVFTENEYADRREASNVGRSAGIIVSLHAIAQSPIIGYGSWTVNEEFARMLAQEIQKEDKQAQVSTGNVFRSHSQLLQAWVEGGLLGAVFFLFYGYMLVKTLRWYSLIRPLDSFSPMLIFLVVLGLWNLLASPFGGGQRVMIALAVASAAAASFERLDKRRALKPASQNPVLHASSPIARQDNAIMRRSH